MKTVAVFGLAVSLLVSGCVAMPYYDAYQQQYPYQAAPPVQYAPQQVAPVGCIPPYVPSWNGCALPMYRPQYYIAPMYGGYYGAPMYYGDPLFRFNFNFGKGGKHRGGGHNR